MKEVYHCTPLEMDKQPDFMIQLHREFMNSENRQHNLEVKRAMRKSKNKA